MKKEVIELSVIITAHDEGLLAHKTMLSVLRALEISRVNKYEIIVHIDCGTDDTIKYFQRYVDDKHFKIIQNCFGDLGESRNAAVKVARGKYVLFRDADDLVSNNYVAEVLKILRTHKEDVVVGVQYCLSFWDCTGKFLLQELPDSTTREENAKLIFGVNPWGSSLAGKREIFLKHHYISTKDGFGHEDYAFNIGLMADNIPYYSAPGTVLFYRRKNNSLITQNSGNHVTQPYSELFDYKTWQKYAEPKAFIWEQESKEKKVSLLKNIYQMARHDSKAFNALIQPVATFVRKVTGKKLIEDGTTILAPKIPDAVLKAWKEQSDIEMQLFPTKHYQKCGWLEYKLDADPARYLSHEYWKLCQQIKHKPDYIFIVPWIVAGGSDKVMLNYITALRQIHPEWKITVITTSDSQNTWKERLPEEVNLIEFGKTVAKIPDEYCKDMVMTRLLIQLQCKKIHIINAVYGYEWVQKHLELAKTQFEIYVSLFADGQFTDGTGGWWGYGDPYLARIYTAVKKAFTDNQNYVDKLIKMNAFDSEKVLPIYQPIEIPAIRHKIKTHFKDDKLRILWASRIVASKNPELVVRIARKLDPEKYQIDVFGRFDEDYTDFSFPEDVATLTYKGEFDGFDSLPVDDYDVLLYTSYSDGMPNVVLEAAATGLPIIASNVGGVSNLIRNNETGFLIDKIEDEDEYMKILEKIHQNPKVLTTITNNATQLLRKQHDWKKFRQVVRDEF